MNGPMRVSFVVAVLSILVLSAAPAHAARCAPCEAVHERCSAKCFGLDKAKIGGCLVDCGNEAATCSCDEAVTLSSEEFVARFGAPARLGSPVMTEFSEACHSTPACGTDYGSCASWSNYTMCGDSYCAYFVLGCGECGGREDPCEGPALRQWIERYRVCFNAQGEPCTEYQVSNVDVGCGC
jgi:hypothetical protein